MKKRTTIIASAVAGTILAASALAACGHHHSPEERADKMVKKISHKLDLNAPQISQLEQLKNELLNAQKSMRAERETVANEIDDLLSQPRLDQTRALELVQARTDAIKQKAPQVINALAGFYDDLNPEQQTMLREKLAAYKEHKHRWHN